MVVPKTALVTGAGRRLGLAFAEALAVDGWSVAFHVNSSAARAQQAVNAITRNGGTAAVIKADLSDRAQASALVDRAVAELGPLGLLINNAAIRPAQPFLETTDDDWARVMDVNFNAAVWLCRAFLPGMMDGGWGRIVNFTGMNAQRGTGGRPIVTASKHACWGLTKALAREFASQGVTCNIISPGTFPDQDMDVATSDAMQGLLEQTPAGRLGASVDIAAIVGLLCSDQGGFINGQILQVNGGVET